MVPYKGGNGIKVGECRAPVDPDYVREVEKLYGYEASAVRGGVENNKHNPFTTCYYLYMKKQSKQGSPSRYDINSELFDYELLERECKSPKAKDRNKSSIGSLSKHITHES